MSEIKEQIEALLGDSNDDTAESGEDTESGEETRSETSEEIEEESSADGEETEEGEEVSDEEENSANEEESADEEEDSDSKSELDKLRAEVDRLSALVGEKAKTPEESAPDSAPAPEPEPVEIFDENFDFDSVVENEEDFKEFMNSLVKKVQSETHQSILQSLPDTVAKYVSQQIETQNAAKSFYENNPDLANTKQYVSVTANEVAAEHPDWTLDQVLDETAKKVRKALGLKEQAKKTEKSTDQKKSPALAKGTQGQSSKKKPKQEISAMEKEILSLMEEE